MTKARQRIGWILFGTHVRLGNPLFTHVLFPTYVAALVWGGLYLLDARLRLLMGPRPRG